MKRKNNGSSPNELAEDVEVIDDPVPRPVMPLRDTVVFPQQVVPLTVGRAQSLASVRDAMESDKQIVLLTQLEAETDDPRAKDLHRHGTLSTILKTLHMPDGSETIFVQGDERVEIIEFTQEAPSIQAYIRELPDVTTDSVEVEALELSLKHGYQRLAELAPYLSNEHVVMVHNAESPGNLADLIDSTLNVSVNQKQLLLETLDVKKRLEMVNETLSHELQVQELSSQIHTQVQGQMDQSHREFYLREQIKAIRKELGEDVDGESDLDVLRAKIKEADLPEEAEKAANDELARLGRIVPASPEYSVARDYLDWLLALPWNETTEDNLNLKEARKTLERDHYDLEKVKKRILEFLAVRKLKADMRGPILCFVGPPGVGKTSLGRSIADALGREFVRVSLGGIRDEAEIRGHRRTYVGALPGRIARGMKKAGTSNPVFMLDEIDKIGVDFHGDPSAALLEVLDPEQNSAFSDHYLEVPLDLSKVLFIATANWAGPIPVPLQDRMETIDIPGYSTEDKILIAQKFLLPKQITEHGLKKRQISFNKNALDAAITDYTREAGVRNLDRTIASVIRGVAYEIAMGKIDRRTINAKDLPDYLGPKKFFAEMADRTRYPGVATGLAWTPFGGEILFIEATNMRGKGRLNLTGHLGDVMKESAQAALSFIRSQADSFNIETDFLDETDLHLHVPAGAVPKDGPSAGIAICAAIVSLLTGRPIKKGIAMTGEITLLGLVLPVGGVKEKILAARRAGIHTVILPERNRADVEEVPEDVRKKMKFIHVKGIGEVIEAALGKRRHRLNGVKN